jgi:ABC-type antimicrobial peptide transport system permease subunit
LSIQEIGSMEDVVAGAVETQRFALQMVGVFAVVALALALIGVYSVVAYTVSRRSREIAIRLAVGAQPIDTVALVVGLAAKAILAGLFAGSLASFYLTGVLTGLLYQVRPADPLTFAVVAALLAAEALAACIGPARRALHFDPLVILRGD